MKVWLTLILCSYNIGRHLYASCCSITWLSICCCLSVSEVFLLSTSLFKNYFSMRNWLHIVSWWRLICKSKTSSAVSYFSVLLDKRRQKSENRFQNFVSNRLTSAVFFGWNFVNLTERISSAKQTPSFSNWFQLQKRSTFCSTESRGFAIAENPSLWKHWLILASAPELWNALLLNAIFCGWSETCRRVPWVVLHFAACLWLFGSACLLFSWNGELDLHNRFFQSDQGWGF